MNICFLGHRPSDLGGWNENELQKNIKRNIKNILVESFASNKDLVVLTGLFLGPEMWAGEIAYELKIPYKVYIPFKDPHSKWIKKTAQQYTFLKNHAASKETIDRGHFDPKKIYEKDMYLVNESEKVYVCFVKMVPIIKYAKKLNKQIIDIMPNENEDDFFIQI
ncbi:MAG: SLOG family protein [Nanoarchaeota archaeon]